MLHKHTLLNHLQKAVKEADGEISWLFIIAYKSFMVRCKTFSQKSNPDQNKNSMCEVITLEHQQAPAWNMQMRDA